MPPISNCGYARLQIHGSPRPVDRICAFLSLTSCATTISVAWHAFEALLPHQLKLDLLLPHLLGNRLVTSMEALGSVSSVIAVVQIAGSVAKLCGGYIADVKDARQDIERLQQKAAILRDVLQRLAEENDGTKLHPRLLSDNVLKSVNQCSQDLRRLQEKLQPKTRHKTMSRVGLRALHWPLSKYSVNQEVKMIEGYLAIFNVALQLGHMYVSYPVEFIHTFS